MSHRHNIKQYTEIEHLQTTGIISFPPKNNMRDSLMVSSLVWFVLTKYSYLSEHKY